MASLSAAVEASRTFTNVEKVETAGRPLAHRAASVLLIATLLAAPLPFGAVQPWAWASLLLLVLLSLLLWAVGSVQQGVLRIVWSPLYLPAGLFLALGVLQYFGSFTLDRYSTRDSVLSLAADLIVFFLAGQLFATGSPGMWRALGFAVTIFTFGLAVFAILQYFSSHGRIYWVVKSAGWTFGPYVNHNHYAGLMEMLMPMVVAYVLCDRGPLPRAASRVFVVLVPIASVFLSGSRGGVLSLLAEIVILGGVLFWRIPAAGGRSLIMVGALAIAAALLFFWMDSGDIAKRLVAVVSPDKAEEVELKYRLRVARDSLGLVRAHPWLGAGLGSFEDAFARYQSVASDRVWTHAHNDYLEALAETGLAGGLLILAALGIFLGSAFQNLQERLQHTAGWIQLGATIGCCGLLIHSLSDFNFHIPANAAWFAACAALATHGSLLSSFEKFKV